MAQINIGLGDEVCTKELAELVAGVSGSKAPSPSTHPYLLERLVNIWTVLCCETLAGRLPRASRKGSIVLSNDSKIRHLSGNKPDGAMTTIMKVLLYDDDHLEMLSMLIKGLMPDHKLLVVTRQDISESIKRTIDFSNAHVEFFDRTKLETNRIFLRDLTRKVKKFRPEASFFNTIPPYSPFHYFFFRQVDGKKFLTIHNVQTWTSVNFKGGFRTFIGSLFNHLLIKQAEHLVVLDANVQAYLSKKLPKKIIEVLPYTCADEQSFPNPEPGYRPFKIVIPGAVEEKRRDYLNILPALEILSRTFNIEVLFLGPLIGEYGTKIHNTYIDAGVNAKFYPQGVSTEEFEKHAFNSDVFLSPIRVETQYFGVSETYGLSKATGVIFDIVRYGKIGILPIQLRIPTEYSQNVVQYSDEQELVQVLEDFISKKDHLRTYQEAAAANARKLDLKRVKWDLRRMLTN